MKKLLKLILICTLFFCLVAFSPSGQDLSLNGDQIIFGETYALQSGEKLEGNLLLLGGVANLENRSIINGNVTVLGGVMEADGTINGDTTVIGGSVTLGDNAIVNGNLNTITGHLNRSENAIISGTINDSEDGLISINGMNLPSFSFTPQKAATTGLDFLFGVLKSFGQVLVLSALAIFMILVMPNSSRVIASALTHKTWSALGIGFLAVLVTPFLILVLSITIILIPIAVLVVLAFSLSILLGWLVIGFEIGERMKTMFKASWHAAISALIGTSTLTLLAKSLSLIPCIGWVLPAVVSVLGLGAVIMTLWGTKPGSDSLVIKPEPLPATDQSASFPTGQDATVGGEKNASAAINGSNKEEIS